MTANQLQYWQNVERERANRAQEQTIPSEIALNYANTGLSEAKTVGEQLAHLLQQFELQKQPYKVQQERYATEQGRLATELQSAEQLGKLFDARVSANRDIPGYAEALAGFTNVGDLFRGLFGDWFNLKF